MTTIAQLEIVGVDSAGNVTLKGGRPGEDIRIVCRVGDTVSFELPDEPRFVPVSEYSKDDARQYLEALGRQAGETMLAIQRNALNLMKRLGLQLAGQIEADSPFDTGDVVKHKTLGTLTVACCHGSTFHPMGFPDGILQCDDVVLISRASEADREYLVKKMAEGTGIGHRPICAKERLERSTVQAADNFYDYYD